MINDDDVDDEENVYLLLSTMELRLTYCTVLYCTVTVIVPGMIIIIEWVL